jgi:ABC-type antimicrobial peptide transport system permease subunit
MSLLIRTHLHLATRSLRQNRTRSFLTCLGIAIGIAAIILILSLSGGIKRLITAQISAAGSDLIVIRPSSSQDMISGIITELTSSNQYLKSNLSLSDIDVIKSITTVTYASPLAVSENTLEADRTLDSVTTVATNPDLDNILNLPMKNGQFLNPTLRTNTVVLGNTLALNLFGTTEAIGKTVKLSGTSLMVVGVISKLADPINFNNIDFDHALFINTSFMKTIDDSLQIQQINVKVSTTDALDTTTHQIRESLLTAKSGNQNFSVLSGDSISHPAGSLFSIISSMLTLVASISLLVGGIGVMNIMLVSVGERTREIGIRKAVGASSGNILLQFLFESLILSLLGGILGFALGYALTFATSLITPFEPYISGEIIATVATITLTLGLIFGIYPALKAARKNPIDSLKHYR